MAQDAIQGYLQRPAHYKNIDGTSELTVAGVYLTMVALGYVESLLPPKPHSPASLLLLCSILVSFYLAGYLAIRALKRRITWPRTGYMVPREAGKTWIIAFAGGALAVAAVWLFHRLTGGRTVPLSRLATPVGQWMLYGILVFYSRGEHPWKWYILLFMAAGLGIITLAVPESSITRWTVCFAAFTWLASGLITLYLYIRRTHPPAPEAE